MSQLMEEATEKKEEQQQSEDLLAAFLKTVEEIPEQDKKVALAIDKMRLALAQEGVPQFRNFWEIRKRCLELFKGEVAPAVRAELWKQYTELSKEARRLKELLDEQSAFAVEQIDIAVKALEEEIGTLSDQTAKQPDPELSFQGFFLKGRSSGYAALQKELNLLNTFAARINTLRKELIRTNMRIKFKNKFFERLSKAGDAVFPRRKELIKLVSDRFIGDIDAFVQLHFSQEPLKEPIFRLREEIKALQGMAKTLTLNTQAFSYGRSRLSECWERLKECDKERKKELSAKQELFRENAEKVSALIEAFKEEYAKGEMSSGAARKRLEEISATMRQLELGRNEVKTLKGQMAEAGKELEERLKAEEEARRKEEERKVKEREALQERLAEAVKALCAEAEGLEAETLQERREALLKEINDAPIYASLKKRIKQELHAIEHLILLKKEEAEIAEAGADSEAVRELRRILKQRKKRRIEIKEELRQISGASGLDFEQAIRHNELINAATARLEEADRQIEELEQKIRALKS